MSRCSGFVPLPSATSARRLIFIFNKNIYSFDIQKLDTTSIYGCGNKDASCSNSSRDAVWWSTRSGLTSTLFPELNLTREKLWGRGWSNVRSYPPSLHLIFSLSNNKNKIKNKAWLWVRNGQTRLWSVEIVNVKKKVWTNQIRRLLSSSLLWFPVLTDDWWPGRETWRLKYETRREGKRIEILVSCEAIGFSITLSSPPPPQKKKKKLKAFRVCNGLNLTNTTRNLHTLPDPSFCTCNGTGWFQT